MSQVLWCILCTAVSCPKNIIHGLKDHYMWIEQQITFILIGLSYMDWAFFLWEANSRKKNCIYCLPLLLHFQFPPLCCLLGTKVSMKRKESNYRKDLTCKGMSVSRRSWRKPMTRNRDILSDSKTKSSVAWPLNWVVGSSFRKGLN